jgi:hypothetical protein
VLDLKKDQKSIPRIVDIRRALWLISATASERVFKRYLNKSGALREIEVVEKKLRDALDERRQINETPMPVAMKVETKKVVKQLGYG